METKKIADMTSGRSFDSAYGFSFAIALGLTRSISVTCCGAVFRIARAAL